ncbi:hypothetical protein [Paracraurococcus ruber]|nr:hypothetical protein [Paracraurococcus ruber]TDG30378.1 hypothetical protein E2C05_14680 [Paracraurococcus ruber]
MPAAAPSWPAGLHDLRPQSGRRSDVSLPARVASRLLRHTRVMAGKASGLARTLQADLRELGQAEARILRQAAGAMPSNGRAICLYAHFSPAGRVTDMVLRQLEEYTLLGFDVVFVSASPRLQEEDWQAVLDRCAVAIHRRNYALDFGSWCDAARTLRHEIAGAEELLLANDSVLGPIRPLDPVFATLRSGGDGLFGLTESMQHIVHLQSYLLLARGRAAVGDLLDFLLGMRLSARKSAIIRRGELAVSGHMARRGHRVAALYGYAELEAAILADPAESRRLMGLRPFAWAIGLPPAERDARLQRALLAVPMNPTHDFWAPLIRRMGFPFIKTELVTKNPAAVPDAPDWESLVGPDAPCPAPLIAQHLALR